MADSDKKLDSLMYGGVPHVYKETARLLKQQDLLAVPVVDKKEKAWWSFRCGHWSDCASLAGRACAWLSCWSVIDYNTYTGFNFWICDTLCFN